MHLSFTIFHEDDKTLSDVWSVYDEDFEVFYTSAVRDMEQYGKVKRVKAKLPVAVFVNHAATDGYHACKLCREMEAFAAAAAEWMP